MASDEEPNNAPPELPLGLPPLERKPKRARRSSKVATSVLAAANRLRPSNAVPSKQGWWTAGFSEYGVALRRVIWEELARHTVRYAFGGLSVAALATTVWFGGIGKLQQAVIQESNANGWTAVVTREK